jgi:hypothetical protein
MTMIQKMECIIFFFIVLITSVNGQKNYQWPYLGVNIPRYLALTGGYEGVKTNNLIVGVAINAFKMGRIPPIGGIAGGGLFYKQSTSSAKIYSYEAEIGFYSGFALGLNYSYNVTSSSRISGFKPFIGISLYNFQILYGYCFFDSTLDKKNELKHNRITFRYIIPVLKLNKK